MGKEVGGERRGGERNTGEMNTKKYKRQLDKDIDTEKRDKNNERNENTKREKEREGDQWQNDNEDENIQRRGTEGKEEVIIEVNRDSEKKNCEIGTVLHVSHISTKKKKEKKT